MTDPSDSRRMLVMDDGPILPEGAKVGDLLRMVRGDGPRAGQEMGWCRLTGEGGGIDGYEVIETPLHINIDAEPQNADWLREVARLRQTGEEE